MEINVRLEEENDYRRVEEITRVAFGYPDRIKRGQIGCPYEHWMVHARFGFKEAEVYGIAEGYNYPAFMAMELKEGYLKGFAGGRYFESDIYDDELNCETVKAFDREFTNG